MPNRTPADCPHPRLFHDTASLPRRMVGIDVLRMLPVVTVVIEHADGSIQQFNREFGGFNRDRRAMVAWLTEFGVQPVVGIAAGAPCRPPVEGESCLATWDRPRAEKRAASTSAKAVNHCANVISQYRRFLSEQCAG